MSAFYNEIDPYAAAWLRNLIAAGHIAPGVVDERSIEDIEPAELARYTQCHFFAGIGAWSYALRLADWPDDRPVWTGSCPCQPFSSAGKGAGFADERHLWPAFHWLISQCRPAVVFGEQVASKDGLAWLDLVRTDLEGSGYAAGAADLCAAGIGAPHIRQRLYWVADAQHDDGRADEQGRGPDRRAADGGGGAVVRLDHHHHQGLEGQRNGHRAEVGHGPEQARSVAEAGESGGLADTSRSRHGEHQRNAGAVAGSRGRDEGQKPQLGRLAQAAGNRGEDGGVANAGDGSGQRCQPRAIERGLPASAGEDAAVWPRPTNGYWADADWLFCRDGKWRPVEPGTFPLAHGVAGRVGRLRAYGNAIVPQVAQTFIKAYLAHP